MEIVKKYLFWVCTPIGLLVVLLAGMMAIASVANALNEKKKQLDDQKSQTQTLRGGAPTHPNQGTIDSINEKREVLADNVLAAWKIMVEEQEKRNRWDGLAAMAIADITGKDFLAPLEGRTLNNYLDFARDEINKLLDNSRINRIRRYDTQNTEGLRLPPDPIRLTESRGASGDIRGGRGSSAASAASDIGNLLGGRVVWDNPQLEFTMRDWTRQPQSFEVWLTQEDLWVYQALLWVVAESNKNVTSDPNRRVATGAAGGARAGAGSSSTGGSGGPPLNLGDENFVVKEIVALNIGKTAALELEKQSSRRVSSSLGGAEGGARESSFGSSESGSSFGSASSDGIGRGVTPEALRAEALAGRYVDAEGKPLMVPELTGELRRMPIYLRFVVDQRRFHEVLVNCANCPMPIDVLWVSINPDAGQSFEFASSLGSAAGSDGGGSTSFIRQPSRSGGSSLQRGGGQSIGGRGGSGDVEFGPHAITIEIFGCINIFTPPDAKKLSGET